MSPKKSENEEVKQIMKTSDFTGDLNVFLAQYNYQPELTEHLDNLEDVAIDQSLINEIVLWKVNRYVRINDDIEVQISELKLLKAGEHRKSKKELSSLLELNGVDIPMASTIFRFINHEVFQIIDRHAYRAVYEKKYPLDTNSPTERKIAVYFDYIDELIKLCESKLLAFATIDRLLYIFDKKNNGKL